MLKCGFFLNLCSPQMLGKIAYRQPLVKREPLCSQLLGVSTFCKRNLPKRNDQPVWSSEVMGSNVLCLVVGRHKALLLVGTTPHGNHLLHWSPGCPGDLAHGLVQRIGLDGHSTRDEGNPVSASHWMDVVVAGGKVVRLMMVDVGHKNLQEIMEWVKYSSRLLIIYDSFVSFRLSFLDRDQVLLKCWCLQLNSFLF